VRLYKALGMPDIISLRTAVRLSCRLCHEDLARLKMSEEAKKGSGPLYDLQTALLTAYAHLHNAENALDDISVGDTRIVGV
jgi:hypothetical protein